MSDNEPGASRSDEADTDTFEDATDNLDVEEKEKVDDDVVKDSLGHSIDSPDYVDEAKLSSWETGEHPLSETDLEQKRLEAAQYKLEGNSLYSEGKILEAVGKTSCYLLLLIQTISQTSTLPASEFVPSSSPRTDPSSTPTELR